MVIEVFIVPSGMPSNSARMSPRWQIGTPTLPTSPLRQHVVAVVAGLGRQIEGDRKAGLPLGEVLAVERVRIRGGRMPGIGAENPGLVALEACRVARLVALRLARIAVRIRCDRSAALLQRAKCAPRQCLKCTRTTPSRNTATSTRLRCVYRPDDDQPDDRADEHQHDERRMTTPMIEREIPAKARLPRKQPDRR